MANDKRSRGRGEEAGYISKKNGYCVKRDRSTTMPEEVMSVTNHITAIQSI